MGLGRAGSRAARRAMKGWIHLLDTCVVGSRTDPGQKPAVYAPDDAVTAQDPSSAVRRYLGVAMVVLAACSPGNDAMAEYEHPPYAVEASIADNVEVRSYESMLLAEVTVDGDRGTASSRAFRILAGFIFGGNTSRPPLAATAQTGENETTAVEAQRESQKIAMTVPVTQSLTGENTWRVSFMMPSAYSTETLPIPNDERIKVYETSPYRALALRFSGRHSDENFETHIDKLRDLARANAINVRGQPILAYYNGPFTLPFLRRNEVMFVLAQ